jgi:hypothetical protein
MGILKHVLFWPVTGPMFLTEFALDRVMGVVKEELTDDTRIKADLMELHLLLEMDEIDDDEYIRREAMLMRQIREVREWRERFGMGVSGGLVRVQAAESEDAPEAADAVAEEEERAPEVARPDTAEIDLHFGWE